MNSPARTSQQILTYHPIKTVSQWLSDGRITSVDLVSDAIKGHAPSSDDFDAYKTWDPRQALALAEQADARRRSGGDCAPMHGIPVSVKDNYGMEEYPLYAGCPRPMPPKWNYSGPVVNSLRDSSCVFMGKTHTVQFAYGGLGVNSHWGTPRNPFDPVAHRVCGGSSSGAGVSLHEGSAMIAIGSDTAGSVRVPASFTANFGLKPSKELWSADGIVPLSIYLDTPGILAKHASDLAFAFHALQPGDRRQASFLKTIDDVVKRHKFTLGICDNLLWTDADAHIVNQCEQALQAFESSGRIEMKDVDFPEAQLAVDFRNSGGTASAELIEFMNSEIPDWEEDLDPVIKDRIGIAGDIDAVEFLGRLRLLREFAANVSKGFDGCAAIACPTVPITPPLLSDLQPIENYRRINLRALANTCVANILNLCAVTIPVGLDDHGMPVGLQCLAPAGNEWKLILISCLLQDIVDSAEITYR